jgi:hypothetical protein
MHGTWIPEETSEFIQPGGFFVWVEGPYRDTSR